MKKIIFVYPNGDIDIRLYKFLKELKDTHDLIIISPPFKEKGHLKLFKDIDFKKIKKIDVSSNINANYPFNLIRYLKISKIINEENPDIIICRDIMISLFALFIKKKYRKKLVLDLCDNMPEVLKIMFGSKGEMLYFIANIIEKIALKTFNKVIFVSKEAKEFIEKKHKIRIDGEILENVPLEMKVEISKSTIKNTMVYIGTINKRIRNLDIVFNAFYELKKKKQLEYFLDIYYFDNQESIKAEYENLSYTLGLEKNIKFKRCVNHAELKSVLMQYEIGVIPHCRNDATDNTIPNKIYDYMNAGLKIIASDNPSLVNLLKTYKVGETYSGDSIESLIESLDKITNIKESYYSEDTILKIEKNLNWSKQIKRLGL